MSDELRARFIGAPVEVTYDRPPLVEKRPGRPDGFVWEGRSYRVKAVLKEWHDYRRRGRFARNMSQAHAAVAERRGSWGVGRDYYRVLTETGEVFDLYYDRAPQGVEGRKGGWFLFRQVEEGGE
jgi:hypothetical protein